MEKSSSFSGYNKSNELRLFNVTETDVRNISSSSKGNQVKWYKDGYWIKRNFLGYESLSEVVCSELLKSIKQLEYVKYNFCRVKYLGGLIRNCCYSKDFLSNGESIIPLGRLLKVNDRFMKYYMRLEPINRVNLLIDRTFEVTGLDLTDYIGRQIYLDSIILNEDRHLFNLALIDCGDKTFKECPIFDNGGSLLSDLTAYPRDVPLIHNISRVKSKPFHSKFSKQTEMFINLGVKPLKIEIDKMSLGDIKYENDVDLVRAKKALELRLRETEGVLWERA